MWYLAYLFLSSNNGFTSAAFTTQEACEARKEVMERQVDAKEGYFRCVYMEAERYKGRERLKGKLD